MWDLTLLQMLHVLSELDVYMHLYWPQQSKINTNCPLFYFHNARKEMPLCLNSNSHTKGTTPSVAILYFWNTFLRIKGNRCQSMLYWEKCSTRYVYSEKSESRHYNICIGFIRDSDLCLKGISIALSFLKKPKWKLLFWNFFFCGSRKLVSVLIIKDLVCLM